MNLLATFLLVTATAFCQAGVPSAGPTSPTPALSAGPSTTLASAVRTPSPSAVPTSAPPTSSMEATSVIPTPSLGPKPSSFSVVSSIQPSLSSSLKSVAPSISASVAPSNHSMSKSISPSASSPTAPASSKAPTTQQPTTTTPPKPKYAIDAIFEDDKTGKPCVWFMANAHLVYHYEGMNETAVPLTKGFTVSPTGECSNFMHVNDTSMIKLVWPNVTLTVQFKVTKDKSWTFHTIGVTLDVNVKAVNGNGPTKVKLTARKDFSDAENGQYFHANANHTYSCGTTDTVSLVSNNMKTYNVSIAFDSIKVQPFSNNGTLSDETDSCSNKTNPSNSSSIVPIAVGCALAGLIVIVLIAYLIGRRKNDGRGYQQV